MNVDKYLLNKNVIVLGKLLLKGDELYIQSYDPVNGRDQMVFTADKNLLGKITSDFYWDLEKIMIKTQGC